MNGETTSIVKNTLVTVLAAVVLLAGAAFGNWATDGGLLRLLNGVTQQEMQRHTHPSVEVQVGTFLAQGIAGAMLPRDPDEVGGVRTYRGTVAFDNAFSQVPDVVLGMTWLDTERAYNTRVTLEVESVTTTSFVYRANTWLDSQVYMVGGSWVAVAAPPQD